MVGVPLSGAVTFRHALRPGDLPQTAVRADLLGGGLKAGQSAYGATGGNTKPHFLQAFAPEPPARFG